MIRLQVLGTVGLRDSDGREIETLLRRPKLLALLGYLAAARPLGFHRRDTLVALLWPELDTAHARNSLRQALHGLREALGRDALLIRGEEEVGLSEVHVWCDVREFGTGLDAAQNEHALELFHGELLPGLHVSGCSEFEHWLDQERKYLAKRALEATLNLSMLAEERGDYVAAARWARRATEIGPYDESALRRVLRLLDHVGRRADAVREFEDFAARLALDLDVAPSPETHALMETIRARVTPQVVVSAGDLPIKHHDADAAPRTTPVPGRRVSPALRRNALIGAVVVATLLTAAFLVGPRLGARRSEAGASPKRLAVLPFANLGSAEDEYFADGITEEIATRLASVGRFRVIGTSARIFKGTKKSLSQIGAELRVDYVVTGSIRWQRSPHGPARVRVMPQLVNVQDGADVWAQVYDEPLDEIFRVQSDIAQQVVRALDVRLLEPERRLVEAEPTSNLVAYEYYLRGNEYMRRGSEERVTRAGLRMLQKAVDLDAAFALAWARLSQMHSRMYWFYFDHSEARLSQARAAADKALSLDADLPDAHIALGSYYFLGRLEYERALREYDLAAAKRPSSSDVFQDRAAVHNRMGHLREGLANWRIARELDPGSTLIASNYAQTADRLHDFAAAESLYDRTIALSPDWAFPYYAKAGLYLRWEGNTRKARAVLEEARAVGVADQPQVLYGRVQVEMFDRKYAQAIGLLSATAPPVFADQFRFVPKSQLSAQIYGLMQRHDLERAYYDASRAFLLTNLRQHPDDPRMHTALGIAYAGLNRTQEAIDEGQKAVALLPMSKEAYRGYALVWDLARIYTMVGDYDAATSQLEQLLAVPGHLTVAWLRIDPTWDALRGQARFQRIVGSERPSS